MVLDRNREVGSQSLFHRLVLEELKKESPYYVVSPERLRRISAKLAGVKIFVEKRRSEREAKRCFLCGGELEVMMAQDILGDETAVGKRCKTCGFKMDKKNLLPRRYIFYKK